MTKMINLAHELSYEVACRKAYSKQVEQPQIIYEKDSGLCGVMPESTWNFIKIGTPILRVSHIDNGMQVAKYE